MRSRWMAAIGGLMLLGVPAVATAQLPPGIPHAHVAPLASHAPGSIEGVVRDQGGAPLAGAVVSAIGATTKFAVTDRSGRFELEALSPGAYLVRAHISGFQPSSAQSIDVRSRAKSTSVFALRRAGATRALLVAGIGAAAQPEPPPVEPEQPPDPSVGGNDDHSETAWRLRHARRGILKDSRLPDDLLPDDEPTGRTGAPVDFLGRAVESSARLTTNFFVDTPLSGQVNILTTGSFETPEQLFSSSALSRGITYARVGAPVGSHADWNVRGALTQADISSWILAGSYATRAPARHKYDVGWSYSTQRYDGGNPLARRDVADGSRNAGMVYGFDTYSITPALSVSYGGRFARYDYLDSRYLVSPLVQVTIAPTARTRLSGVLSRTAHAPGAEEFLPPGDTGIWLPPQRTFSSFEIGQPLRAERTTHLAVTIERDIASSTISVRAFRQEIDDQLVTLFGVDLPGQPDAKLGHYFVGNGGDATAIGCSAGVRTTFASRVRGSVAYSLTQAQLAPADELRYLVLLAPSAIRPDAEQIHDVSTSIETNVPETATRVLVLYRVGNGFARGSTADRPRLDSRFDVQVRQALPFLNFTSAKWEMLVAVRDFFRESSLDQSVYDELLVVRPPKRIVGGVTMHF